MKIRLYTDTSAPGGWEDEELAEHSVRLLEAFVRGEVVLALSSLTVQELAGAPAKIRRRLASQEVDDPFLKHLRDGPAEY